MMAATAINYFGRVIMSIAGPDIMKHYGFTETELGGVYSAFGATYLLAMIPAGWLVDRFGPHRTLGIFGLASGLITATTGLCGLSSSPITVWSLLIASRLLFGVCSAPVFSACARLTGNWFLPIKFGLVLGCVGGASAIGASAAPVLFAWSIPVYGWRWSFCAAGAATLLLFALWTKRVRDYPANAPSAPPRPQSFALHAGFIAVLRNRRILLLAASYLSLGYLYGIFDYWIYYYLRDVRHVSHESSALFSSIAQATQLISIPLGGWVSDAVYARHRLGRMWFAVAALILSSLLLFLGTRSAEAMSTVVLLCVAFGIAASVDPTYFATSIEIAPESAGAAYAIVNSGGSCGSFIAPIVLPMLASRFGWAAALASASVMIVAGGLVWLWIGSHPAREASAYAASARSR